MGKRLVVTITLLYLLMPFLAAQPEKSYKVEKDTLDIALLTCSAGPEVYALYGHTAFLVRNLSQGSDEVFNYGTFNMADPYFIPKFTLGWMDYELGVMSWKQFSDHYSYDGADITVQLLNLTSQEESLLYQRLKENALPQNRGYRYNFLYDNCSTRPRDMLESVVQGELVWADDDIPATYRSLMHECNTQWPWSRLGVDLCLGQQADQPITPRQKQFLPACLMMHAEGAVIFNPDKRMRPLVRETRIVPAVVKPEYRPEFWLTPMQCACVLLIGVVMLTVCECCMKRLWWGIDTLLELCRGLAGMIIFILFFFSVHPTVGSNWLLWVFNPLPLLYLPFQISRRRKQQKEPWQYARTIMLALFLAVFAFLPQRLPIEVLPVVMALLIRSVRTLYYDFYRSKLLNRI